MQRNLIYTMSAVAILVLAATSAFAQDVAKLYRNKTVTIYVGYGAGGTYGRTALLLAAHLKKTFPGNPNFVVSHMPGAGGIKAANFFAHAAPQTGLALLVPPEMTAVSELLRPNKVKFKTNEFTWLGRLFGQNNTLVVRRDSGIKTLEDLKTKQIILASSGKGSPTYLLPRLLNALLGTKLKIVTGYKGSRKMQLAMEQGEVQGSAMGYFAFTSSKPEWFKGKDSFAIALVQSGLERKETLKDVRLIRELLTNDVDKKVAAMLASSAVIGRGLVLPPKAPKYLVEPLRAAFAALMKDKDFIADAKKRGLQVDPLSGATIQKVISDLMSMPESTRQRAREIIFGKKKG